MKKKTKWIIGLLVAMGGMLALAGCSGDRSPYPGLDQNNYTVSVRYDANGGSVSSQTDVAVVHAYPVNEKTVINADGDYEFKLIEPGSPMLGKDQALSTFTKSDYILTGWYKTRTERVNEEGKPLDAYGRVLHKETVTVGDTTKEVWVTDSGETSEPGYIYSDKWDFTSDRLVVDAEGTLTSSEPLLTLYAAWTPYYVFEFVTIENDREVTVGKYRFAPTSDEKALTIELPEWTNGKIDMKNFSSYSGKTFEKAYTDATLSTEYTSPIRHNATVDEETALLNDGIQKIYTTWVDGEWYRITEAKQFVDYITIEGCYDILADLDFTNVNWKNSMSTGRFNGTVKGNGHSFSNITVTQSNASDLRGGLFGEIGANAEFTDVSFTNITYKLNAGSRLAGAYFGLFAGYVADTAKLDLTVDGTIEIGYSTLYTTYLNQIGVFSGNLVTGAGNVSTAGIAVKTVANSQNQYPIKATVEADGSIVIENNEDPTKDPNETQSDNQNGG